MMNMKFQFRIVTTLALLFGANAALMAQEETGTGDEVKSVEIRVVEEYQAQVRSAQKISEQPSFSDTTSAKIPVSVRINPKAMSLDFTPEAIPAIRLGRVKLPKLPTQSVSLGGGNYASSYASFILSSPRSKKNVWGVRALHQGALSGVRDVDFVRQPQYENELLADYQRATKSYNFKTQVLLKADYTSYYGALTPLTVVPDSTPGVWQQQYGLSQQWLRTTNPTSRVKFAYRSGGLSYKYTAGGLATSEHLAKTKHRFEIYADEQDISLDMGYQFSSVNSWADSSASAYHNFTIAPHTSGQKGILSYEFGLNFTGTQTSGLGIDRFEYYVYPKVNLQAELLKRTLAVYGGWDGTAKQNTLESMIAEVPFLSMDQEYRLSGSNKGYVGMQGALAGKLQYRVEGSLTSMNDALMFQRDSLLMFTEVNGQQWAALQAVYAENVVKTGIRGELNLPLKHFVASTYAELNNYTGDAFLGQEGRVLGVMLDYSINELSTGVNLRYVGGRYNSSNYSLYPLEDYMDLSARIEYKINENLSVSLRGYNLLNQRYMMWQGYGVRGTRGMFVLNYKF
jgi:hypothetical protein